MFQRQRCGCASTGSDDSSRVACPVAFPEEPMKRPDETGISSSGGTVNEREHMAAYLLGELQPQEELILEQDYFSSDDRYEQLLAIEDELAYDYVEGRLSPARLRHF